MIFIFIYTYIQLFCSDANRLKEENEICEGFGEREKQYIYIIYIYI